MKEELLDIIQDLKGGHLVSDEIFDDIFPPDIKKLSSTHWTPVEVALRATELLEVNPQSKILDVGSGCGKFCLVGALSSKAHFTGIEQRETLTEASINAAKELSLTNTSFINGNMKDLDWTQFDGFYLFNTFFENKLPPGVWIDDKFPHKHAQFNHYVKIVINKLRDAKIGTRVVTYYGFGGDFPPSYTCLQRVSIGTGILELWKKTY